MLTTTLDGLWVLQVLSGIESLAPELGLRPVLPSAEPRESALAHPIAAELQAAGAISADGTVDPVIVEWLTVLSRRDVALLMYISTPADSAMVGVLLARFAQWWVAIERAEEIVRIGPAGAATAEGSAIAVIRGQIERLLGTLEPAPIRPATIDAGDLVAHVTSPDTLRVFLDGQRLEPEQIRALMLATDTGRSASASIVALQSGAEGAPGRIHVEHGSVTIYDTPEGRLLVEHAPSGGRKWMIVSPGSVANITTAINGMLRRLPAREEWFSHRRIV
ncbi:MAG: ESX secretion-associated protein EspG [Mycobacterium sp.]|nr:ESX secretion-associated protein EspG [Mycobacterium sp.]